MTDYGIKISQTGSDVKTTDLHGLVVTSKYPNPKTYIVGTYNYTFPSDLSSVNIFITHNLGYISPCFVYYKKPGASVWGQLPWVDEASSGYLRDWFIFLITTDLIIHYGESPGNPYNPTGETWSFKYYVMVDKFV